MDVCVMNLENILENLMMPNTHLIKKAQNEIFKEFERPETVAHLLHIMAYHEKSSLRQYAALLLRKRFSNEDHYSKVPTETRLEIKRMGLNLIFNESENSVRSSISQLLAYVFIHENCYNRVWINECLLQLLDGLKTPNEQYNEISATILYNISEISPEILLERFNEVGKVFESTLLEAEANITAVPSKIFNCILKTMGFLAEEMKGFEDVENFYQAAVPHIVNILSKTVSYEIFGNNFSAAVDILLNMAENAPHLLDPYIKVLIDFLLSVSCNSNYAAEKRIECLMCLEAIVNAKSAILTKLHLVELIVTTTFHIISTEPENDDANEFFINCEDETPLTSANILMDTIAKKIPSIYFLELILGLVDRALRDSVFHLRRRGGFIVLGTIAEGCRDFICENYLDAIVIALKQGLSDQCQCVQNAALFAISQFTEFLQPEITEHACDFLPVLLTYAKNLAKTITNAQSLDVKYMERVFGALINICYTMEDALTPFVGEIMGLIFHLMEVNQKNVQMQALNLLDVLAVANCGYLEPWCELLFQRLNLGFLGLMNERSVENKKSDELRLHTISTLAEIVRDCCEHYLPYADETTQLCIDWIQNTTDIDERKHLLNLFGALANVVGEQFSVAMPVVVQNITMCLKASNNGADDDALDEINIQVDEELEECCSFKNPYIEVKECAFNIIEELTEVCPQALLSYADVLFELLLKSSEHCCMTISKCCFAALKSLTIAWFLSDPNDKGKLAIEKLIERFINILRNSYEHGIVTAALNSLCDVLTEIGKEVLKTKQFHALIAQCVLDGLQFKHECQRCHALTYDPDYKDDASFYDKNVIEKLFDLFDCFGKALSPQEFREYFDKCEIYLLKHINDSNTDENGALYASLISSLASYYTSLGREAQTYFPTHYKGLLLAIKRKNSKVLRNAISAIGQLFFVANEISYAYFEELINHLSQIAATQPKRTVVESIIGALARLILTNFEKVPLDTVVPVIMQNLTLLTKEEEVQIVFECIEFLCERFPEHMEIYMEPIVIKVMASIANDIYELALVRIAVQLLKKLSAISPDKYEKSLLNPALETIKLKALERVAIEKIVT